MFDILTYILPISIIIAFIINTIICIWIYKDAKNNNLKGGIYYSILELFLPIIGIIAYKINKRKILG